MGAKKNYLLFILLFFFEYVPAIAQDVTKKEPLVQVLMKLQDRYDHKFNYFEDTVEGISIVPPNSTYSFEQALTYLRNNTGLIFTLLENNFVSIKRKGVSILCGY
ncbi:MAG: TonB-dependent receptor, partial [Bacteroidetes bacterium]